MEKFQAEIMPASSHSLKPLKTAPLKTRDARTTRTPAAVALVISGHTLFGTQPLPNPAKTIPLTPAATAARTMVPSSSACE